MHPESEFTADLTGFTGTLPLFPLEGVVLFPHVALPLHIFEQRYRRMVADALDSNRLIAMALPRSGGDASGNPELFETVCIGRITAEEKLSGGRYNIVLNGVQRAVCTGELVSDLPYRVGQLELLPDYYPMDSQIDRQQRQSELLKTFRRLFRPGRTDSLFQQILDAELPLGVLCDLLTAALRVPTATKYKALAETDVDNRSSLVLETLRGMLNRLVRESPSAKFPPRFSLN